MTCPRCHAPLAIAKISADRAAAAFPDHTPRTDTVYRYCPADDLVVLVSAGQVIAVEGETEDRPEGEATR